LLVPRRAIAAVLAVAAAATAFVLPGDPARAVAVDAPDASAWVTNGDVHAVVSGGGRTYIGGTFDQVGPNTGFGVGLDPATGALTLANAKVNGHVYAAVPNGAGGWFIAGDFTRVGPVSRHYAAEIRGDGSVTGWNPNPDLPVYALAFDGSNRVYLGGEFTTIRRSTAEGGGDINAAGLAATRRNDGSADLSAPLPSITPGRDANDARLAVKALSLAAGNGRLFVGGTFATIGGTARSGLAAVDLSGTPALDGLWAPQPDGPVAALQYTGPAGLFVGGSFTSIGGGSRNGFAAVDPSATGTLNAAWGVFTDGPVLSMAMADGGAGLLIGGSFTKVGEPSLPDSATAWYDHRALAKLNLGGSGGAMVNSFDPSPDGAVLSLGLSPDGSRLYAGGAFQTIGGQGRRFLAALDAATGAVDPTFDARVAATVRAVAPSATTVYAGGDFSSVGGVMRRNLAALDSAGKPDLGFSADTDGEVNTLLLNGNSLYVGGTYRNLPPASGGQHRGLTKVDAATGVVDNNFKVKIDASVWTLGLAGSQLFVGGNFSSVKDGSGVDIARSRAAAVNALTGAVGAWNPGPDAGIHHLVVSADQSRVYLGGDFANVGGAARTRLAAVNLTDGAATSWKPAPPAMIQKMAVSPDGATIFVALGGRYGVGNRIQAWRTTNNTRVWDVEGDGDFQAVVATNSLVYAGGHFGMLNGNSVARQHLAAFDPATGTVQPWGPSIGGVHGVLDLFVTDSHIWVAGEFDNIGNEAIQGIARFTNLGDTPPVTTPPTQPPVTTPPTAPPGGNPGPGGGGSDPGVIPSSTRAGYWMVGADGKVYSFGEAGHFGNAAPAAGSSAVDLEPTPSGNGYWIVTDRGVVTTSGDAVAYGQPAAAALTRGETVTSLSATPTGRGYWIFTSKGRAMNFGDAAFYGDMSKVTLNGPVLDSIPTTSGKGYYMVASDGGIFAFGDARFFGSMGGKPLNKPVQSLVPDGDGVGYWLVASDGGIFAFQAGFRGSMGGKALNKPVTGMVRFADGYLMVGEDGGIFNFSSKPFLGSLGGNPPARPIVSVAALG
jgi:hypothetical protein